MSLLYDYLVELQLDRLPLDHFLFDGILADQSVDKDLFLLTDAMSAVHRLEVGLRIPVRIIQDDMIGCHQIKA